MKRTDTTSTSGRLQQNPGTKYSPPRQTPTPQQQYTHHQNQKPQPLPSRSNTATTTSRTYQHDHHLPNRPSPPTRQNTTDYISMLLALDTIPRLHNILASFSTWILLAGFLIFPGTFTSLDKLSIPSSSSSPASTIEAAILHSVKNLPLLVIASICTFIGATGMLWLWYRHSNNYVWLLNRIFLPGALNSVAGVISTLIGVYSQNRGQWSVTALVTVGVTGGVAVVCGGLFGIYNFWVLEGVKKRHAREMGGLERAGEEGWKEKMGRRAREPALEPGSVV